MSEDLSSFWRNPDLSPFDGDDAAKLDNARAVPCRICETAFGRLRLTLRYYHNCKKGFCEGEHGTFSQGKPAYCVQCAAR